MGHETPTRRRWLTACVSASAVAGLAGCTSSDEASDDSEQDSRSIDGESNDSSNEDSVHGEWPMEGFNAANQASVADRTGPTDSVEEDWVYEIDARGISTPVVAEGTVYVGTTQRTYYAIDIKSGELEWEHPTELEGSSCAPVAANDAVYVANASLEALDPQTGDPLTSIELNTKIEYIRAHGDVIVAAGENKIRKIDADLESVEWGAKTTDRVFDIAISDGGSVYAKTGKEYGDEKVEAFDSENGDSLWVQSCPEVGDSGLAIGEGNVYTFEHNTIVAIDLDSGDVDYITEVSNPESIISVLNDVAYATSAPDKPLSAVDIKTKSELPDWDIDIGRPNGHGRPSISSEAVYFWGGLYTLYAVDSSTGDKFWEYKVEGENDPTPPIVLENRILYSNIENGVVSLKRM